MIKLNKMDDINEFREIDDGCSIGTELGAHTIGDRFAGPWLKKAWESRKPIVAPPISAKPTKVHPIPYMRPTVKIEISPESHINIGHDRGWVKRDDIYKEGVEIAKAGKSSRFCLQESGKDGSYNTPKSDTLRLCGWLDYHNIHKIDKDKEVPVSENNPVYGVL